MGFWRVWFEWNGLVELTTMEPVYEGRQVDYGKTFEVFFDKSRNEDIQSEIHKKH